jgi:hypothetical protein
MVDDLEFLGVRRCQLLYTESVLGHRGEALVPQAG